MKIIDTTLRDGLQDPTLALQEIDKIKILKILDKSSFKIIEAGFPVANYLSEPNFYYELKNIKNKEIHLLARALVKDINIAHFALSGIENSVIHIFLPVSDIHITQKLGSTRGKVIEILKSSVKYSYQKNPNIKIRFGLEDATRADLDFLAEVIEEINQLPVEYITIADTVGLITPLEVANLIKFFKNKTDKKLIWHGHNDSGNANSNAITAIQAGVNFVEGTIGGIGERAGNLDIINTLLQLSIKKETQVDTLNLKQVLIDTFLVIKRTLPDNYPFFGTSTFKHSSGIHQDGVIKNPQTYSILKELNQEIVINNLSGYAGLKSRLVAIGRKLNDEELKSKLEIIKSTPNKIWLDEDLKTL